jgi:hypothetical protein
MRKELATMGTEFRDVFWRTGAQGILVPVVGRLSLLLGRRLRER